jgi:hypothetical protein
MGESPPICDHVLWVFSGEVREIEAFGDHLVIASAEIT